MKRDVILFGIITLFLLFLPIKTTADNYQVYQVVETELSKILVTNGFDYYFITYGFGCYSSDFHDDQIMASTPFLNNLSHWHLVS